MVPAECKPSVGIPASGACSGGLLRTPCEHEVIELREVRHQAILQADDDVRQSPSLPLVALPEYLQSEATGWRW